MRISTLVAFSVGLVSVAAGCGRAPSRLLRQGQLPIYDFPLYLTEGIPGRVWKIDADRQKTLLAEGLSDPRGLATDRFHNVYVAEYGAGRVLKLKPDGGPYEVVKEGLLQPSVVAVDSMGDVYVSQDGAQSISRASDDKIFGSYSTLATALTFGVNDQVVVGLYGSNRVLWGWEEESPTGTDVTTPSNASIDGTGRVYVAQGDPQDGKVYRYHQREPGEATLVADHLVGPSGIAVDLIGNIFVVEQGAGRIVLISYDGNKYAWVSDVEDPQYIAFTQY